MWEREAGMKRNKILYHLEAQHTLLEIHTSKRIIPPLDRKMENKAGKSRTLESRTGTITWGLEGTGEYSEPLQTDTYGEGGLQLAEDKSRSRQRLPKQRPQPGLYEEMTFLVFPWRVQ